MIAVLAGLFLPASAAAAPYTLVQLRLGHERTALPTLGLLRAEQVSARVGVWRLPTATAQQVVPGLRAAGLVRAVEPDAVVAAADHFTHGDPLLADEYWLAQIRADIVEPPGPGRPVVVIDAGLDLTHPEFAGRPDTGAMNPQVINPRRQDEHHGTAVSSLVGAPANGIGVVGVYPQAVLYSWDASPTGQLLSSEIIAGLQAAGDLCPAVINLSLGSTQRSDILEDAVHVAFERGCLVVAASGNSRSEGSPLEFPANYSHVLTVGATDRTGNVASFSSATPALDLAAPGDDVPIALPTVFRASGFASGSGTSFSSPIVAGATAWVWTVRPELDKTQLFELMRRSSRDIASPGFDPDSGFGMLDLPNALALPAPAVDPLEPNDDIDEVAANGMFATPKPAVTSPTRQNTTIVARIDAQEDPDDVYRAYLPPRKKLTITLKPTREGDLEVWSSSTLTVLERTIARAPHRLGRSAKPGAAADVVTLTNSTTRGQIVYVDASISENAAVAASDYALTIKATALPKPKPVARKKKR